MKFYTYRQASLGGFGGAGVAWSPHETVHRAVNTDVSSPAQGLRMIRRCTTKTRGAHSQPQPRTVATHR